MNTVQVDFNQPVSLEHAPGLYDAFQTFLTETGNAQWLGADGFFVVTLTKTADEKLFNVQAGNANMGSSRAGGDSESESVDYGGVTSGGGLGKQGDTP